MDIYTKDAINNKLTKKQDTLVSGTNIKTINGNSLLGSGNISLGGSGSGSGDALVRIHIYNISDAATGKNDNSLVFVGYRNSINSSLETLGLNLETLSSNWQTLMTGENAIQIWMGLHTFLSLGVCISCFYTIGGKQAVSPIIDAGYLGYILLNNTTPEGHVVFATVDALTTAFANSSMVLDKELE